MNCLHPISLPNPRVRVLLDRLNGIGEVRQPIERSFNELDKSLKDGKIDRSSLSKRIKYLRSLQNLDERTDLVVRELDIIPWDIFVPCRICPNCLKKRQWEWRGRLIKEFQHQTMLGHNCAMVTLTYAPEYIADAKETYASDIASFFDGLRSKFRRSFRHWCIAELGEKKGRFHVHCLIWDVPESFFEWSVNTPFGYKSLHKCKNGQWAGYAPILYKYWPKGLNDTTLCSINATTYVTDYLTSQDEKGKSRYFKGKIYCSNGIGMHPDSDDDFWQIYCKIRDDVKKGIYPTWKYGNFVFPVPTYIYNKCVDRFDKMLIQYCSSMRSLRGGGKFECNGHRFESMSDYYSFIKSFYSGVYNVITQEEELFLEDRKFRDFKSLVLAYIESSEYKENELLLNVYCDEFYIDLSIFDSPPPF